MWRVLLVEPQPDYAAILKDAFREHPQLRLVATTDDGPQATRLAKVLRPDAILVNVALCAHERFAVLDNIMSHSPTRVLVYASGQRAYDLALERARQFGAIATSPLAPATAEQASALGELLVRTCTQHLKPESRDQRPRLPIGAPTPRGARDEGEARAEPELAPATAPQPPRLVAIGASTGGPAAIEVLLRRWPKDFMLPVVVAQHMTPGFNTDLVGWLNTLGSLEVKLAEDGELLRAGTMYFAPDGHHVALMGDDQLRLTPARPDEPTVPNVNYLFHSVARFLGAAAIGVLLTGMGEDGATGLLDMRRVGARTIVQNQASALVFGMPQAAVKLGAAQLVFGLEDIAGYVFDCQNALRRGRK